MSGETKNPLEAEVDAVETPLIAPPSKNTVNETYNQVADKFVQQLMQIMCLSGVKEIDYTKRTIVTPNGGLYLLSFQHVSGPKVKCELTE